MASAPPMETATLVGHPPPPSYEEALGSNPMYPPGPYPPPVDMKGPVPPYSTQAYGQAYPPPPTQQGQPVTSPVVSVQTVYVQPGLVFGTVPVQAHCPVCIQNVITRLEYTSGALVWLSCAGLAIFGCIYGCCLIPFCVDNLKDVIHHCPNCSSVLGFYRRI
ncbi:lipopolysaccharide-induced tumor necrosis factor-alpha factor homolog [Megalobrama amblycephala]|uniref:Lipopolysaccharide-induced TNFa factor n=1 Tax=Megalobrama amblycephala TaxID=75352 RepID=A0A1U9Y643_MEGAM|nr:lipopolysaccharide-induced tumor necrosis factor-alpha factor homolog [Megalobrama amblycephala]XP_048049154.1 lipopolysaccharide-induced tumor necrosis factor-alpha factor homolog [Megalobrama amblycephala]AQZ36543.1 lipopolysaccharide-induced TNFa factor [Megalobrama amblycephala]